jgi:nucleoside-diphosphate-sugar epimerase
MKILVVGGTGFLGSATARELQKRHHEVVVTGRKIFREAEWTTGLRLIEWNAENDWTLDETSFDVIVHFAGPKDDSSSLDAHQDASRATQKVLNLWRTSGGSVLYVSTFQVFGRWAGQVRSTDKANPTSTYGKLHLQNENLLQKAFTETSKGLLIVRPTNIVGHTANSKSINWHRVPAEFCLQAALGSPIEIRSDSQTQRDYLSVSVFANRIASLVEQRHRWDCRAVTIGFGKSYSLLQVAILVRDLAKETFGLQVPIIEATSTLPDKPLQVDFEKWNGIDLVGKSELNLQSEIKNLLLLARALQEQTRTKVNKVVR